MHTHHTHRELDSKIHDVVTYDCRTREPRVNWSQYIQPVPASADAELQLVDGVYVVQVGGRWMVHVPTILDFIKHLLMTVEIANDKMITTYCYDRNKYLEQKYKLH